MINSSRKYILSPFTSMYHITLLELINCPRIPYDTESPTLKFDALEEQEHPIHAHRYARNPSVQQ